MLLSSIKVECILKFLIKEDFIAFKILVGLEVFIKIQNFNNYFFIKKISKAEVKASLMTSEASSVRVD